MKTKHTVDFQVAFGAVKHFGRNLYTSNPPAIAELVANAWDAYATTCDIIYDDNKKSLLIADDGIGMTDEEFEKRYAVSGMDKDSTGIRVPDGVENRPYMGRKGIGKFSVFSLGAEFYIYTKSEKDREWKRARLVYDELMINQPIIPIEVDYISDLKEIQDNFANCNININSGTIIVIPKMTRSFTKRTSNSLKSILSRRFSVNISGKYGFSLKMNSEEVDLTKHFYDQQIEFLYYFGYDILEMKERFSGIQDDNFFISFKNEYLIENKVKGWIGSVAKTSDLKIDEELNSSGVIVYINGKLADDDILQVSQNSTVANLYLVGEVEADYLQSEEEDPVLSSREGLNKEIPNVKKLRSSVDEVRKSLIAKWAELRSLRKEPEQDYLVKIKDNSEYKKLYDNLEPKEKQEFKKYSQRLFDTNKDNEQLFDYYVPFVFSIVNTKTINEIKINSEDDNIVILEKFMELFNKSEINSALRLKANVQDRLNVIEELEKEIEAEAKEDVFEKHLANNPWLLNPFWDSKRNKIIRQQRYEALFDGSYVKGRSDIIIEAADESYPIIVEIKREKSTSYSTPSLEDIKNQISKYRRGIKKLLIENDTHKYINIDLFDIKAYMLLGAKAVGKLEQDDIKDLEQNKIVIMTYEQIIENASNIYTHEKWGLN